ncbi:4-hydroxythreonine-4-phosphate dehydrogenase PdxA [Hydrogenophaga sp.]|uniref:4-hydroxythreonine-4-phosphate dehydrogenase PdxA n=2 Tax=Hydrogenophaga sp. TaxID=1904254 RepID=UPI002D1FA5BF|nr:4-hydroxythreonine-4-phosphate dehydrogenase PdxA [Hydrogenophaga sp.]
MTRAMVAPVVVSMGDPAGIGPEIVVAAVMERPDWLERLVVAGDAATLERAARVVAAVRDQAAPAIVGVQSPGDVTSPAGLRVWQVCDPQPPVVWGFVQPEAGRMAARCIRAAAAAALSGQVRALVTAPIHKEALSLAGEPWPGHTEMLQALAAGHLGCPVADLPVRMMLSEPHLRTVLVSIHVSLREAIEAVTTDRVLETLLITDRHFLRFGGRRARIAVAGLNPHAGEGGLFGREEADIIAPAVERARAQGLDVQGPFPPDTVFMRARQGAFDVVIAMYHDQGLIAVKLLGLDHGVNTTLGLPFVRTSPDHGTAFDLAGTGRASPASLLAALEAADQASGPVA